MSTIKSVSLEKLDAAPPVMLLEWQTQYSRLGMFQCLTWGTNYMSTREWCQSKLLRKSIWAVISTSNPFYQLAYHASISAPFLLWEVVPRSLVPRKWFPGFWANINSKLIETYLILYRHIGENLRVDSNKARLIIERRLKRKSAQHTGITFLYF